MLLQAQTEIPIAEDHPLGGGSRLHRQPIKIRCPIARTS